MSRILIGFVAVALLAAPTAGKENPSSDSPLLTGLSNCAAISDGAARLACYDKAAGDLLRATAAGEVAMVDRHQVREMRKSLFGFSLPDIPFLGRRGARNEEEPKQLVTKLASFRSAGNGRFRFTVEEGKALWETTESALLNDPKSGATVTINRGVLGSYFVKIDDQPWVRARRVR